MPAAMCNRTRTQKGRLCDSIVNVTNPYYPITSDDKALNLEPFADAILDAVAAANILPCSLGW